MARVSEQLLQASLVAPRSTLVRGVERVGEKEKATAADADCELWFRGRGFGANGSSSRFLRGLLACLIDRAGALDQRSEADFGDRLGLELVGLFAAVQPTKHLSRCSELSFRLRLGPREPACLPARAVRLPSSPRSALSRLHRRQLQHNARRRDRMRSRNPPASTLCPSDSNSKGPSSRRAGWRTPSASRSNGG